MRPEHLAVARRTLGADLAELLAAAGLDDEAREAIGEPVRELLDRLLYLLDTGEWDRRTGALVAEFTLMQVWPEVLRRLAPALAIDIDDARRLQQVLEARRWPVGAEEAARLRLQAAAEAAIPEQLRAELRAGIDPVSRAVAGRVREAIQADRAVERPAF